MNDVRIVVPAQSERLIEPFVWERFKKIQGDYPDAFLAGG